MLDVRYFIKRATFLDSNLNTMKMLCTALTVLPVSVLVRAQNLVPNGSFEEYTICPEFLDEVDRAAPWYPFYGTPDLFNSCNTNGFADVPLNYAANAYASHGEGYTGLLPGWVDPAGSCERFEAPLVTTLQVGVPVHVSFKARPATQGNGGSFRFSSSHVGVHFSTVPLQWTSDSELPNHAAAYLTTAPVDTVNWTFVSAVYVPDSAYGYVQIGTWFEADSIEIAIINPSGVAAAYTLIDEVCVSFEQTPCYGGTAVNEPTALSVSAYPNPFVQMLTVSFGRQTTTPTNLIVTDLFGKVCYWATLPAGTTSWRIEGLTLPKGELLVACRTNDTPFQTTRVTHVSP